MPTKLDVLKRDAELAKDHVVRKAYEAAVARPNSELKRACDLYDTALHRLYVEKAAIGLALLVVVLV